MNTLQTQEKISAIITEQYNNYNGRLLKTLSKIHRLLRNRLGDEGFLLFLEEQKNTNPQPKYGE